MSGCPRSRSRSASMILSLPSSPAAREHPTKHTSVSQKDQGERARRWGVRAESSRAMLAGERMCSGRCCASRVQLPQGLQRAHLRASTPLGALTPKLGAHSQRPARAPTCGTHRPSGQDPRHPYRRRCPNLPGGRRRLHGAAFAARSASLACLMQEMEKWRLPPLLCCPATSCHVGKWTEGPIRLRGGRRRGRCRAR